MYKVVKKYHTHIMWPTKPDDSVHQENHLHHHEISKHFSVSEPTHNVLAQCYIKSNKVEFIAKQKWPYLQPETNIQKHDRYIDKPQFDWSLIESQV